MSRGLGKTQRAILDELTRTEYRYLTTKDLADALGRSADQIRAACDGLVARGLIHVERGHIGWKGYGEYGRLYLYRSYYHTGDVPKVTVKAGEKWPNSDWRKTKQDTEFVRNGVPVYGRRITLVEGVDTGSSVP